MYIPGYVIRRRPGERPVYAFPPLSLLWRCGAEIFITAWARVNGYPQIRG